MLLKKKENFYLKKKPIHSSTCVCAFFLHKITVSRPTRSITSRIRSCFANIRAGTSVVFDDEEDFFFHVLDDSVNITSFIVSPTLRKSFALEILNKQNVN